MPALRSLLCTLLLGQSVLVRSLDSTDALASDDECQAGDSQCALNALQLRGQKVRAAPVDADDPDELSADATTEAPAEAPEAPTTEAPAEAPEAPTDEVPAEVPTGGDDIVDKNETKVTETSSTTTTTTTTLKCQRSYQQCGGIGYKGDTECCPGLTCVGKNEYYLQCVHGNEVPFKMDEVLKTPSEAPLQTFYVYRAVANLSYPPDNVNVGNLAGMMWYLHHEVVVTTPRKFGIMKIKRYKIQTKAPKPLFEAGMNFGVRYAFDMGQCTGPWYCGQMFQKYGYFVGCNDLGDFPYPDFPVYYPGAVWYSLPSTCPLKTYNYHDAACNKEQPGGHCDRTPDGTGTCTWNLEDAGEIWLDDLVNLDNYDEFVSNHGQEYDPFTDEGVGMTFWNGINDTKACANRVAKALALFEKEYPDDPKDADMPTPKCDFDFEKFYGHPYNATTGGAAAGNTTEHLDTAGR